MVSRETPIICDTDEPFKRATGSASTSSPSRRHDASDDCGRQLRIAVLLAADFPEGAASTGRIKCHASGLKDQGHDLTLLFFWQGPFSNGTVNTEMNGTWEGIPFRFLNRSNRRPTTRPAKLYDTLVSAYNSSRYLIRNRRQFDVLYLYCPAIRSCLPIYAIAAAFGIPIVVEETELPSLFYLQPGHRRRLMHLAAIISERLTHRVADQCVVISERLYAHHRQRYPESRLHRVPIVVDVEHFNPAVALPQRCLVGYVGCFAAKQGIPGLLRAFARARFERPELRLRLIGCCEDQAGLSQAIGDADLTGSVEMTGPVRYDEVPRLLGQCDLAIVNRVDSPYSQFSFPTKLGEYLAAGIPVITTKVSDVERYLVHEEHALLVAPDCDDALHRAIVQRYREYDRYTRMGLRGREVAIRHFDHRHWASKLADICAVAVQSRARLLHADVGRATKSS